MGLLLAIVPASLFLLSPGLCFILFLTSFFFSCPIIMIIIIIIIFNVLGLFYGISCSASLDVESYKIALAAFYALPSMRKIKCPFYFALSSVFPGLAFLYSQLHMQ